MLKVSNSNLKIYEKFILFDFVPQPPILIYYGFVMHICKIFRPKKLQIL
jgi:hypothetical protein